jgi:hypothetical protein
MIVNREIERPAARLQAPGFRIRLPRIIRVMCPFGGEAVVLKHPFRRAGLAPGSYRATMILLSRVSANDDAIA